MKHPSHFSTTPHLPCRTVSHSVMSNSLQPHGPQTTRLLCPWNSPGKNTRVGNHSLLQGVFPTWESNSGLLLGRQILYLLSRRGRPAKVPDELGPQSLYFIPDISWVPVLVCASLLFLKIVVKCTQHKINLKYTIQWHFVHSLCCATITSWF